jgi:hypothetical protein
VNPQIKAAFLGQFPSSVTEVGSEEDERQAEVPMRTWNLLAIDSALCQLLWRIWTLNLGFPKSNFPPVHITP